MDLGKLFRLNRLDLSHNRLMFLPRELGHLFSLRELDLTGNQLTLIPTELAQINSLKTLNLFGNPLISPLLERTNNVSSLLSYLKDQTSESLTAIESADFATDSKRKHSLSTDISKWTVAQVGEWLAHIGFAQYRDSFARNAIDGKVLKDLTMDELRSDLKVSLKHVQPLSKEIDSQKIIYKQLITPPTPTVKSNLLGGTGTIKRTESGVVLAPSSPPKEKKNSLKNPLDWI